MASIISIRGNLPTRANLPQAKQENEEVNASLPITPQYKYHHENDFDYWNHYIESGIFGGLYGDDTEWSQDPNDAIGLHLNYRSFWDVSSSFSNTGILRVESHNTFEIQNKQNLGAYIDFHIDIDVLSVLNPDDINSVLISLMILKPDGTETQLINIYNLEPQTGRFYVPNFDQYIWLSGKIRFALMGFTFGIGSALGGINLLLSFEGLRVVQEITPKVQAAEKRSLILVHGYSFTSKPETPSTWTTFLFAQEFLEAYEDIIVISYYGQFKAFRYSKDADGIWTETVIRRNEVIDKYWKIEDIASVLAQYIVQDHLGIEDNVDFITHSMGGLVVRYMIKWFYDGIQNFYNLTGKDFKIKNVAMMAPPNHGGLWMWIDTQARQMQGDSDFLADLNYNPLIWPIEIPVFGFYINWFTYRSGLNKGFFLDTKLRHDGMVAVDSVPLILQSIGITITNNKGWYQLDHEKLRHNDMLKTVIFNDIIKPPAIIDAIFNGGTPGIIMQIEDLTLQPNYEEPGGKTLLSITLPAEDQEDIVSSTVTLYVSTDSYQMTLKAGTTDTYEVELPLAEGYYPFLITADYQDGGLYQMSGNLRIIDDDVRPPVIQITPGDTSISDEDAVGGVLISWEISDYSGISEANVLLNGVEIRSYTNQGTITDSYLLPNELGEYTISVWARDNDGDPEHDPPGGDWLENSIESTITIYDDDLNPPEIQITPGDLSISDEDAVGGVLISWDISDNSGISEANVTLNGVEIRSYANQGTITDSYLLPNELGVYTLSIWAKDNDNDSGDDWSEYSIERTITIYDDDINPPDIQITPGDLSISDEQAIGGVLISWEISDDSGILEATVMLNGVEIRAYSYQGTITDSYLLPNELGVYTISIWAKDNDNDSGDDWSEYSIERTITIYDDDLNPPEIQVTPGDLTISVEEAEGGVLISWVISDDSGISEANVLLNGTEIRSYANQGTITDSYLLPNEPGVYNFSIWARDNDNDLEDDWLEYSTKITITIYDVDDIPPPAIPGYNIFVLLGIFSVVIILISKKRRNYKI